MSVQGLLQAFDTFQARKKNNAQVTDNLFMAGLACITEPIAPGTCMRRSVDVLDTEEVVEPTVTDTNGNPEEIPRRSVTNEIRTKRCQHNCQVLLGLLDEEFRAVSDDGAMSMVLGKGWHVAEVCPRRRVNLVGADAGSMRKNGL